MKNSRLLLLEKTRRQRLRLWIDTYLDGNQATLCRKIGISSSELSRLLKDKSFGERKARKIEEDAGMPNKWLDDEDSQIDSVDKVAFLGQVVYKVPIISMREISDWKNIVDNNGAGHGNREMANTTKKPKKHTYAIIIHGFAMTNPSATPSFPPETTIIIEPEATAAHGQFVVVKQTGKDEGVFRRLDKDGGNNYLIPLNPQYPIMEMHTDDIICGVAIEALIKL